MQAGHRNHALPHSSGGTSDPLDSLIDDVAEPMVHAEDVSPKNS